MRSLSLLTGMLMPLFAAAAAHTPARAQPETPLSPMPFVSYSEAMARCGALWKASPERAAAKKGERGDAWAAFRAACVTEQGFVKGRKRS